MIHGSCIEDSYIKARSITYMKMRNVTKKLLVRDTQVEANKNMLETCKISKKNGFASIEQTSSLGFIYSQVLRVSTQFLIAFNF